MIRTRPPLAGGLAGLALLLAAGCGAGDRAAVEQSAAPPPPFTADQIRAASAVGRTYVQRSLPDGGTPTLTTFTFVAVDDDGATLEIEAGGETARHRLRWQDFAAHGRQPAGAERSERPCEVPAGTFECIIYVAETPAGRQRTTFAREIPGMPLLIERDGPDGWRPIARVERYLPGGAP